MADNQLATNQPKSPHIAWFILAIIYMISPIDLVPEAILPFIGEIDDLVVALIASGSMKWRLLAMIVVTWFSHFEASTPLISLFGIGLADEIVSSILLFIRWKVLGQKPKPDQLQK